MILTSSSTSSWVRFVAAAWGLSAGTLLLVDALRLRRLAAAATEPVGDLVPTSGPADAPPT